MPVRLGAPALLLTGVLGCQPAACPQQLGTTTHPIGASEHARLFPFGGHTSTDHDVCVELCRGFDVLHTLDAATGMDPGDAGWTDLYYATVECRVTPSDGGPEILSCTYSPTCIGGRAPRGLLAADVEPAGAAGWLARAAHLELASVAAFEDLTRELLAHRAPSRLVRAACAAASDERRHADAVARLARARGARVPSIRRAVTGRRSLYSLAEDNAVEGCVREAYAALVAARQAALAGDADVRGAYASIAVDEAKHALLSFALHDWARTRLSPAEARQIEDCRLAALDRWRWLESEDEVTRVAVGLPTADENAALLTALA